MLSSLKYTKILKIAVCLFIATIAIFLLSNFVLAAGVDTGLSYAAGTGLSAAQDIRVTIVKIIRIAIGFLGIIAVGLIMYAGWIWMTSEGNEEKIEQAKKILTNAIIGLIIIISSFAIVSFILNQLTGAVGNNVNLATTGGGAGGGGIAALGAGIISSHYPERNQQGIARNTKIIITFTEPMNPATIMTGDKINAGNIKIYKTQDGVSNPLSFDVGAAKTDDNKTFVFKPAQYLGSPTEKVWYSAALSKNIKKANGDGAFPGVVGEMAYDWMFEVGTYIDNTPPKIESIIPRPDATEPRNVVVQINFSEAIDPTSASGATNKGFDNIKVMDSAANSLVAGNFYISNQFKTVEFITLDACGLNSCGNTVFCLPANKQIKVLAKAATLEALGAASAVYPYTGLVDLANNSLDGNADGTAQGPQTQSNLPPFNANNQSHNGEGDDYTWQFKTSDVIDTTPPVINQVSPTVGAGTNGTGGVEISAVPQATFSKLLLSSSINNSSVNLKMGSNTAVNYWLNKTDDLSANKTTVSINHDQFNENADYGVQLNSGIKDIYQNCYTPCSGLGITGNPSCCNGTASSNKNCQ